MTPFLVAVLLTDGGRERTLDVGVARAAADLLHKHVFEVRFYGPDLSPPDGHAHSERCIVESRPSKIRRILLALRRNTRLKSEREPAAPIDEVHDYFDFYFRTGKGVENAFFWVDPGDFGTKWGPGVVGVFREYERRAKRISARSQREHHLRAIAKRRRRS